MMSDRANLTFIIKFYDLLIVIKRLNYKKHILLEYRMIKLTKSIPILLIVGAVIVLLPSMGIGSAGAQTFDKFIRFPDVNVTNSNNQNTTLDHEFTLVSNNGLAPIEVINPDFGLSQFPLKLIQGQKYVVNPLNEEDIKYTNITIKVAQVTSISPDVTNPIEADPESGDMSLGTQIDLAHSGGGPSGFIMPSNLPSGNYILYVYIQYPDGITGVFSGLATVAGSSNSNGPIVSNGQGSNSTNL